MNGKIKLIVVTACSILGAINFTSVALADQNAVAEVDCRNNPSAFKLYIHDTHMRTECYIGDGTLHLGQGYVTNVETGLTSGYYTWTPECLRTQDFSNGQNYSYPDPGNTVCSITLTTPVDPGN